MIILVSQQVSTDSYVKSYNPKTRELVETTNIREAKVYKTKSGAESSARSIFEKKYLEDKTTKHIYNPVEVI